MNCENDLCIYQENGVCILDEIELDFQGQCTACIRIDIEDSDLKKLKRKNLIKFSDD
ncbi:MAG: hypothetical protein IJD88_06035 [Clostridia bacterium]|nr:hypothetical protein [Clostridia bacterium]